jgi:hypothetical protein
VKKLVDTSVGRIVLDFYGDGSMNVTRLGDDGWENREGEWSDEEIAMALVAVAGLPSDEAERVADVVRPVYESRKEQRTPQPWDEPGWWRTSWGIGLLVLIMLALIGFIVSVSTVIDVLLSA